MHQLNMEPKNPNKVLGGRLAKGNGLQFENILQFHARHQGILVVQMHLGCRRLGRNKLIQIKTPFDFILICKGSSVYIDCKCYMTDRLTFSMITPHQVNTLKVIRENGEQAGYLVHFKPSNSVVFFDAEKLFKLRPGESYGPLDGVYMGIYENIALGTLFT